MHVWPALTPRQIDRLTVDQWLQFAEAADEWTAARTREAPAEQE